MTSWPRGGEGGRQKLTIVHKPMYYVVKRVTRGREGVKNDEKSSDVICECHLRKTNRFFHFFKYFKYLGVFSNENSESKYLVELS